MSNTPHKLLTESVRARLAADNKIDRIVKLIRDGSVAGADKAIK